MKKIYIITISAKQKDYYPFGREHENSSLMSSTNRWKFNGKEKQTIRDLGWLDFSARMYANCEVPLFTTPDPLMEKYYSISQYAFCGNNPINRIDPNGMDWYEFQDKDGNTQTMWRKLQDKTYTDDNGNTWNNIGENYLSLNGDNATLFTQYKNDDGELFLRSSSYNLADEESANSLTSTMGDILSKGSAVAGAVGGLAEGSNASFRLTNSKGNLDFKFYGNGWKGNQYVTPAALSKLGNGIKTGGNILGGLSAAISFLQMINEPTTLGKIGHGVDGGMSLVGITGTYGLAASLYYFGVLKNYPAIKQSVNQQIIDRANMMQRGFIPVGHSGFPFK
ncbi:MAG: hypothetical protein LBK94_07450 [Prevotellaceae bacterium]|jgi:RHS repeat-associated protein|nr:hypothetical protein [Prevotellaceae bacterium]